jgi:8-oxo-dGTP pyrophosphatase MutT (NUDIX family)
LLNFDRKEPPTVPRHAATVVVVRERAQEGAGLEVFCVLRHPRSSFLGGAVVFPGGKVDPADGAGLWDELATEPHPRSVEMVDAPYPPGVTPRAIAVAACRETLEEACIIPVDAPIEEASVEALRLETASYDGGFAPKPPLTAPGENGLAAALARRGLRLAIDRLVPWARWITPEAEARRFDARFFLLELPPGQAGRHDDHETTMSFWARPAAILDRAARGDIFLAPPTTRSLELLATVETVAGAFALAAQQCLAPILPVFHAGDSAAPHPPPTEPFLALPGDPMHPVRQRRVAGPTRFVLRDGRFIGVDAVEMGAPAPEPPGASEARGGGFT